jgi:hypothetical protein
MMSFETKKRIAQKTVSTQEALAVACAAYRMRNGYLKDTRRYSEEKPTEHSNKEMVKFHFNAKDNSYVDSDFVQFNPNEQDYEHASAIKKWMKRYVLLGIGDLDEFKRDMISSISNDTVQVNNLGRIAFIPEFVKRDQHETALTKEIRVEYRDSEYLGKEKDKVEGVIKIIDKKFSSRWESYNYTAVLDGNLVSFMNKFEHNIGDMKRVQAKVKSLTKNKLFGANETRLNYVKLFKV